MRPVLRLLVAGVSLVQKLGTAVELHVQLVYLTEHLLRGQRAAGNPVYFQDARYLVLVGLLDRWQLRGDRRSRVIRRGAPSQCLGALTGAKDGSLPQNTLL